jgi:hypothetical protein
VKKSMDRTELTVDSQKLKEKTHGVYKRLRTAESAPCKTKPATLGHAEKRESQNQFRALSVLHPPIHAMKKRVPGVLMSALKAPEACSGRSSMAALR